MLADSPGAIALATTEIGRFTLFTVCLSSTRQPDGTNLSINASASVLENFNASLRTLRDEDAWVWILGDDHTWAPDCLLRMLKIMDENPEIDILVPLVTRRNPPWYCVIYHDAGVYEPGEFGEGLPRWRPFEWGEIPQSGTFEVDGAGSAGMLIRRDVIDKMGDPWFETAPYILNEDLMFCQKARALGYKIHATSDVTMGHIGVFNVRPVRREGRWGALTEFSTPEEQFRHIFMPVAEETTETMSGR